MIIMAAVPVAFGVACILYFLWKSKGFNTSQHVAGAANPAQAGNGEAAAESTTPTTQTPSGVMGRVKGLWSRIWPALKWAGVGILVFLFFAWIMAPADPMKEWKGVPHQGFTELTFPLKKGEYSDVLIAPTSGMTTSLEINNARYWELLDIRVKALHGGVNQEFLVRDGELIHLDTREPFTGRISDFTYFRVGMGKNTAYPLLQEGKLKVVTIKTQHHQNLQTRVNMAHAKKP